MAQKTKAEEMALTRLDETVPPAGGDPVSTSPAKSSRGPELADDWQDMMEAPRNRPIYITGDPVEDPGGILAFWRTTRAKHLKQRGWHVRSFWASVLTKRELDFDAYCWRESMPAAAVAALKAQAEAAMPAAAE